MVGQVVEKGRTPRSLVGLSASYVGIVLSRRLVSSPTAPSSLSPLASHRRDSRRKKKFRRTLRRVRREPTESRFEWKKEDEKERSCLFAIFAYVNRSYFVSLRGIVNIKLWLRGDPNLNLDATLCTNRFQQSMSPCVFTYYGKRLMCR